jgi:hypothetical protein
VKKWESFLHSLFLFFPVLSQTLSVKFYSVGEFSRNNKRGKPPLEWKCYNFRAQIKQRKGFPHGYYNKNWRNLE